MPDLTQESPPIGAEPWQLSIAGIGSRLRDGTMSACEITRGYLDRIAALDGRLHSYALTFADEAQIEAERADRELRAGRDRGRLHGVPIAIKDLIDAQGAPTLAGMPLRAGHRADRDATVLRRLRDAGAVLLGKLALTEGAALTHHPTLPAPRNPWALDRDPGFSSSGSGVAVAAGLCAGALGSDTAGSIRIPSAWNGVTGLKPTRGRVSRSGAFPLAPCLDTIGPMARSAEDAAILLAVIAGADPDDPTAEPIPVPDYPATIGEGVHGMTIGIDWERIDADCVPAVADALREAAAVLTDAGARLQSVKLPRPDLAWMMPLLWAAVGDIHRDTFPARAEDYGAGLRALLRAGAAVPAIDVAAALNLAGLLKAELRDLFAKVDLILAPALPDIAPLAGQLIEQTRDDPHVLNGIMAHTMPFNVSGSPTITFPAGFSKDMPVAAQLVAPDFGEELLLRAAHVFQSATDWHQRMPTAK